MTCRPPPAVTPLGGLGLGLAATVSVDGGTAAQHPGRDSVDLVQQVRIPPGNDLVTFHYQPRTCCWRAS